MSSQQPLLVITKPDKYKNEDDELFWVTKENETWFIPDMEDSHIYNVIKVLRRYGFKRVLHIKGCEPEEVTVEDVDDWLRRNKHAYENLFVEASTREILPEDFGDKFLDYVAAGR